MPIKRAKSLALIALGGSLAAASFSNSFFEIFSATFLGLSLVCILAEGKLPSLRSPFALAGAVYLAVVLLTVFGSAYPAESWRGLFRVFRCVLMALFTVYLVDDEKKLSKIFHAFAISACIIAVDALVQGFTGREWLLGRKMTPYTEELMRITGPFTHANDFAAYLSMTVFLFLGTLPYAWKKGTRRGIAWAGAGTALLVSCLVWTYSRGAWIAVSISYFLLALFRRSIRLILALVVGAALVFVVMPDPLKGRVISLGNLKSGTMAERRILWDEALRMTGERPWLGHGINTYSKVEPGYKLKGLPRTDNQYAHNGYLHIAAETGWLGLAAFLAVLAAFFWESFRTPWMRKAGALQAASLSLAFGVLSFLLHSFTDTNLQSLRLVSLLWLSMGLVLAAGRIAQKGTR